MESPDLLGLTVSLTSSTLILAFVAGLMPRLVGDEPNPVVGIRTKATISSPEAWQLAHRIAWPLLRRTAWTAVVGLYMQVGHRCRDRFRICGVGCRLNSRVF